MYYKFIIIIMNNIFGAQIPQKWIAKVSLSSQSERSFNVTLATVLVYT